MQTITIAIVEDDVELAQELVYYLQYQGMVVAFFENGTQLDVWLADNHCDVLILDLNLQGEDGLSISKRLSMRDDLRIIMLTARTLPDDRISGFDCGADVYLHKPVNFAELVSVIRRLVKRLPETTTQHWELHSTNAFLVSPKNEKIKLTTNENKFLQRLSDGQSHYVTRLELENNLWGTSDIHTAHRLELLVSRLRLKLKVNKVDLIQTYWRMGYGLTVYLKKC
jgi:DNA-binding response OmpR family regulator